MPGFTVKTGSVIGCEHILRQINCQDKYNYAEFEVGGALYRVEVIIIPRKDENHD